MLLIIFHRTIFSFQQSSNFSMFFFFYEKILLEVFYERFYFVSYF